MAPFWKHLLSDLFFRMTPTIVTGLQKAVKDLDESAKKTDNPIDDFFTGLLRGIVGDPEE